MSALSRIARDWSIRCFGRDHFLNRPLRALRTLEESAELAQALDVPVATALQCIRTVYSRPKGDADQELGGTLMTAVILSESMGRDPDEILEREIRRVLAKSPEHFAKRNQDKIDLGLDASAQGPGKQPGDLESRERAEREQSERERLPWCRGTED